MHARHRLVIAGILVGTQSILGAADFTVNLSTDSAVSTSGQLRWGFEQANASADTSNALNLSVPNPTTILLVQALPGSTQDLTVDASSVGSVTVSKQVPLDTFDILTVSSGRTTLKDILFSGGDVSVANGAELAVDLSSALTMTDVIKGSGSFIKQGNETLTLQAVNTWTGDTTVEAGTLRGDVNSFPGDVSVNSGANLTVTSFDIGLNPETFASVISGEGRLVKESGHDLTLTGANTFTGGTEVQAGRLIVDPANHTGEVNILGGAFFQVSTNAASEQTYSGNLIGGGSLEKSGTGTVLLTGSNSFTGGTSVLAGDLKGAVSALPGNIAVAAGTRVGFVESGSATYANNISGAGGVFLAGTGTVTFTGAHTFTGGTELQSGKLQLDTLLPGNMTTSAGSTLQGIGGLGGNLNASGTVYPAAGFGILNVAGNATFEPGSRLKVKVDDAGNHSQLTVTGTTTIDGGGIEVDIEPGDYSSPQSYDVLLANGGFLAGDTFPDAPIPDYAFLDVQVDTSNVSNLIRVTIEADVSDLSDFGTTPNQVAVGNAFEDLAAGGLPDTNIVVQNLAVLQASQVPGVLDSLSGESLGGLLHPRLMASKRLGQIIGQRFSACRPLREDAARSPDYPRGIAGWVSGLGLYDSLNSVDTYVYGGAAGLEGQLWGDCGDEKTLRLGVATAYHRFSGCSSNHVTDLSSHAMYAALYTNFQYKGFFMGAAGQYGYHLGRSKRKISVGALSRTATGEPCGQDIAAYGELGWRLPWTGNFRIQPTVAVHYAQLQQDAYTEGGADSLNLAMHSLKQDSLCLDATLTLGYEVMMPDGFSAEPEVYVGWNQQFLDPSASVSGRFHQAPGGSGGFMLSAPFPDKGSLVFGARATRRHDGKPRFIFAYEGRLLGGHCTHSASLSVVIE